MKYGVYVNMLVNLTPGQQSHPLSFDDRIECGTEEAAEATKKETLSNIMAAMATDRGNIVTTPLQVGGLLINSGSIIKSAIVRVVVTDEDDECDGCCCGCCDHEDVGDSDKCEDDAESTDTPEGYQVPGAKCIADEDEED